MELSTCADQLCRRGYGVLWLPRRCTECHADTTKPAATSDVATAAVSAVLPHSLDQPCSATGPVASHDSECGASRVVAPTTAADISAARMLGFDLMDNVKPRQWISEHYDLDRACGFAPVRSRRVNFTYRGVPFPEIPDDAGSAAHTLNEERATHTRLTDIHDRLAAAFPSCVLIAHQLLCHVGNEVQKGRLLEARPGCHLLPGVIHEQVLHSSTSSSRGPKPALSHEDEDGVLALRDGVLTTAAGAASPSSITLQLYDSRTMPGPLCNHGDPGVHPAHPVSRTRAEVAEHVDCTLLTFVCCDAGDVALQVFDQQCGKWVSPARGLTPPDGIDAIPVIVMTGYLLYAALDLPFFAAYSRACVHRVVCEPDRPRTSVVVRLLPDRDAELSLERVHAQATGAAGVSSLPRKPAVDVIADFRQQCASVNSTTGDYATASDPKG